MTSLRPHIFEELTSCHSEVCCSSQWCNTTVVSSQSSFSYSFIFRGTSSAFVCFYPGPNSKKQPLSCPSNLSGHKIYWNDTRTNDPEQFIKKLNKKFWRSKSRSWKKCLGRFFEMCVQRVRGATSKGSGLGARSKIRLTLLSTSPGSMVSKARNLIEACNIVIQPQLRYLQLIMLIRDVCFWLMLKRAQA